MRKNIQIESGIRVCAYFNVGFHPKLQKSIWEWEFIKTRQKQNCVQIRAIYITYVLGKEGRDLQMNDLEGDWTNLLPINKRM